MAKIESYSVEYEEGGQPRVTVLIRLDGRDPVDVVIEKIAASLPKGYQRSFSEGGLVPPRQGRSHPFEGPEVFDDEAKPDYDKWYDEIGARPLGEVPAHYVPGQIVIDPAKTAADLIRAMKLDAPGKPLKDDIASTLPKLRELFEAKRAEAARIVAEGEGDWLLNAEDKVGEDE